MHDITINIFAFFYVFSLKSASVFVTMVLQICFKGQIMKKFAIIYGKAETALQKIAIQELTTMLLDYTFEYPVCMEYDPLAYLADYKCIYIGTKESNPYIQNSSSAILTQDEEYCIKVKNSSVVIEGKDDAGVLYGVLDFYNKYIVKFEHPNTDKYWVNFLERDELPDFEYTSAPSVKERGLWTWGHVIYDYRGYLDNMMRLKMNRVIIWNDYLPPNAKDIVEYAHARNIKVIWGFAWLWDTNCNIIDISDLDSRSEEIFEKYEKELSGTGGDGIYFQTFTELNKDNIGGILIAEAAARFVNNTAAIFYSKYPNMEIQFGLHATSVKNKLDFIATVDKRIKIVWENCGSFPFSYIPTKVPDFNGTVEFVKTVSKLRGEDDRFGVVTKGLVKLDWSEFRHATGPQWIGTSSEYMKKNRIGRKHRIWKYIQAGWIANGDKAYEMVKEMYTQKNGDLSIFALVEDGMFEETVMYPVALYSEMLWDCNGEYKNMAIEVALRSYVTFA